MTGAWCDGVVTNNFKDIRVFKAYAEGAEYRMTAPSATHPKSDNPHVVGSPEAISWDQGWDDALAGNVQECVGGWDRTAPLDP